MVQIPTSFNPRPRLHRHGDVVGLARRLRRHRQRRRVGPEARLRGRLHRQGHRQRRARPRDRHGQPAERHAHRRHGRRQPRRTSRRSLTADELSAFNAAHPNRIAVKHAHSQQNPEKDWGRDTLKAVRFALWALNEQLGDRLADGSATSPFKPDNTIVIASSVSNGAGAALAAAEQDTDGLIDGVAVSEPNVQLPPNPGLVVKRGSTSLTGAGRGLYDYFSLANLYQPCADARRRRGRLAGRGVRSGRHSRPTAARRSRPRDC